MRSLVVYTLYKVAFWQQNIYCSCLIFGLKNKNTQNEYMKKGNAIKQPGISRRKIIPNMGQKP